MPACIAKGVCPSPVVAYYRAGPEIQPRFDRAEISPIGGDSGLIAQLLSLHATQMPACAVCGGVLIAKGVCPSPVVAYYRAGP